jgi:WD40 repeat protein
VVAPSPAPAFSPDGHWLLLRDSKAARLFDLLRDEGIDTPSRDIPLDAAPATLAFTAEGFHLVATGQDKSARVYDLRDVRRDPRTIRDVVESLAHASVSPDGERLVLVDSDGSARLWTLGRDGPPVLLVSRPQASPGPPGSTPARWSGVARWFGGRGRWLIVQDATGSVQCLDLAELRAEPPKTAPTPAPPPGSSPPDQQIKQPFIPDSRGSSLDGRWLAVREKGGPVSLRDLEAPSPSPAPILNTPYFPVTNVPFAMSRDTPQGHERWMALPSESGTNLLRIAADADSPLPVGYSLSGHDSGIFTRAVFSRDNQRLVTLGTEGTVRLWDLSDRDPSCIEPALVAGPAARFAFSPDGHRVVVENGKDLRLWDLNSPDPARGAATLRGSAHPASDFVTSPCGSWLLMTGKSPPATLWKLDDPQASRPAAEPPITGGGLPGAPAAAVPGALINPVRIASFAASSGPPIRVAVLRTNVSIDYWQQGWEKLQPLGSRASVNAVASGTLSFRGQWLTALSHDQDYACLWRLGAQGPAATPRTRLVPENAPAGTRLVLDGTWLIDPSPPDGPTRILDLGTDAVDPPEFNLPKLEGSARYLDAAAVDGGRLLLAGSDGRLELWERPFRQPISLRGSRTFPDSIDSASPSPALLAVPAVLDPSLKRVAFMDETGAIRLWDLAGQPTPCPVELPDSAGLSIEASGDRLITTVIFAFSQDGRWLLGSRGDDRFRLWDLDRKPVAKPVELRGLEQTSFDLQLVVSSRRDRAADANLDLDGNVRVWSLDSPGTGPVSFRPTPSNAVIYPPTLLSWPYGRPVWAIAFGDDGRDREWLMTFSPGGDAWKWTLFPDDLRAVAGRAVGRNLTLAEWEQFLTDQPYRPTISSLPEAPVGFSVLFPSSSFAPPPQPTYAPPPLGYWAPAPPSLPVYYRLIVKTTARPGAPYYTSRP